VKATLEPSWEARFEGSSYGFRSGRGCHDALAKIYVLARPNGQKKWVVDADIKGAFDNINQDHLLRAIGDVPGRELLKQWLKAGVMEGGAFQATTQGTPQGGVISPLLWNIALHGMEAALGVTHDYSGTINGKRAVVRYADDFVVFCESQEDATTALHVLTRWLRLRGLTLSAEKTRIVHLSDGFDFLGFNVRHYEASQTSRSGHKLLIKPSKRSVAGLREKLRDTWRQLHGHPVQEALRRLNPTIRGWANYFRTAVSSRMFAKLDRWMLRRCVRYVRRTHPGKPMTWCLKQYWGRLNPKVNDPWVFGDKRSGHYLLKFSWFPIERHVLVRGTASPDDPSLREYWWARRRVNIRHLIPSDVKLAEAQDWLCPVCGAFLINGEALERHHLKPKGEGGTDAYDNRVLVHQYCHQQLTAAQRGRRD
jgi:RNA-directed DNA polymerase